MCSQPHTNTTTYNTLQNVPSDMYTHPQKDAQSCLSRQEYACGGKGSQVGGQHGLHSKIPVSKHKQGVRKIRGTHIGTSQNMTHRGALTCTGIPHKSPRPYSAQFQHSGWKYWQGTVKKGPVLRWEIRNHRGLLQGSLGLDATRLKSEGLKPNKVAYGVQAGGFSVPFPMEKDLEQHSALYRHPRCPARAGLTFPLRLMSLVFPLGT